MKTLFFLASMIALAATSQAMFSTQQGLPFMSQSTGIQQSFLPQQQQQQQQQQRFSSPMVSQPIQQQSQMFNGPQSHVPQQSNFAAPQQTQFGPANFNRIAQPNQFNSAVPQNQFTGAPQPSQFNNAPVPQNQFVGGSQPRQFNNAPVPQNQFTGAPQPRQLNNAAVPQNQFVGGSQPRPFNNAPVPQNQQFVGAPQPNQFNNMPAQQTQQFMSSPHQKNQFSESKSAHNQQAQFVAQPQPQMSQEFAGAVPQTQFAGVQPQPAVAQKVKTAHSFEPVQPIQPVQSAQPIQRVQSVQRVESAQPIQPVQSAQRIESVQHVQPVQRVEQPAQPIQHVQSNQRVQPVQSVQHPSGVIQQQFSKKVNINSRVNALNVPNIPRFCAFQGSIECDPSFPYRTLNGSCNNLNSLWWGKAETPYKRYLEPDYADKINEPRMSVDGGELPNPYELSCSLHRESHDIEPFVMHIFMQWGQYVSHDVSSLSLTTDEEREMSTCETCTRTQKCLPIPIRENFTCSCINQMRHQCLEFVRSSAAFSDLACNDVRREQLNLQTSYLDGSIIYGIVETDLIPLMENRGRFRVQSRGILPPDMTKEPSDCLDFTDERRCFLAGDNRVNQNPGLQLIQTVLVREHNRIATILGSLNPQWNDRTVFEEARRILIAEIQHITYSEYLPLLLGESVTRLFGLTPLKGTEQVNVYDQSVDPRTANEFAAGAGRFGHSMVRSIYSRADSDYNTIGTFMLRNQYFRSHMFYDDSTNGGLESVARGFLKDPSMKVDQFFSEDLSRHLFETMDDFGRPFHFDLVSLNIQRGREHGLPSYVKYRELCRLSPIRSWNDMRKFVQPGVVDIFMSMYRFVEDVDFYSAGLAEIKQGEGLLGPTFTCIVAKQFHDIKVGDRFWYETNQDPASFTPAQLAEIRKMTLSKVLCSNLKNTPKIQPRAMVSSKIKDNSLMNCAEIPDINWNLWKA